MISIQGRKLRIRLDITIPLLCKYRGGGTAVFRIHNNQMEVLLGLRANRPGRGLWSFPGGEAEQSEKMTSAALREFKEETGVQLYRRYITRTGVLSIKKYFFEWDTVIIESTQNIDLYHIPNPKYGEFISIKWIPLADLGNYKLHKWVKDAVDFYLSDKMKVYIPKISSDPKVPSASRLNKSKKDSGVNCLFDMAEMVLTKVDLDGTKYFKPRFQLSRNT